MTELRTCAHCGTAEGELTEFNGRLYCPDCLDDLTLVCTDCGSRFPRTCNRSENDDFPICPECYDRDYTRCVRCGRIIDTDHCWYPLDNDDPYCADCCSTIENSPIHDYYFKPNPIFYGDGPRYFGVELEIDDGGKCDSSAETLMDIANQSKTLAYCKHDGSLDDGFEIVTHPMSLDCQLHEMPWAEVLDKAISMGYLSHQAGTCGLHIHVSRKAFGDTLDAQDNAIARVLFFVERHWAELLRFSRRTQRQLEQWAARYGYRDRPGEMLDDADLFAKFSKENRTAAQKLLDSLKEFIAKVKSIFTGKVRDVAAQEAYGKDFAELEAVAQKWPAAFDAAEQQADKVKTAAGEGDGVKYQIKQFPNGMKYVQADRQVLFGNDPKAWSEQLESYINGKIRNHEDVRLIAEDGDVLLLTSKSAGKLSSIYDNNGRTLDEKAFERKANAAAHIDELINVSVRGGKTVLDFGGRHGDMAKDGWNYRTAYFMDFDGKYYRTRISVALGKDGSIVYNIGKMQERSTPRIAGSSGNSGALLGNASVNSIPTDGENVKPKFSLKAYSEAEKKAM